MKKVLRSLLAVALTASVVFVQPNIATADDGLDPSTLGMRPSGGFLTAERLAQYESELGRSINWYVAMAGRVSPGGMRSAVYGQVRKDGAVLPTIADRMNLVMTVPLAFGNGGAKTEAARAATRQRLVETAAGEWDDDYRAVARSLIVGGYPDAVIRLGHEFSGSWYPWSAQGNADVYIQAYRHVHSVLAAESADFRFEWNAARATFVEYGAAAYPGDAYVDIIGLDIYHRPYSQNPDDYNEGIWQRRYESALTAHRDFAIAHGKPVSYSEWANGYVDQPEFIQDMYDFFMSLPDSGGGRLLYHSYFNPGRAEFDLDRYAESKSTYLNLFGGPDAGPAPSPASLPGTNDAPPEPTPAPPQPTPVPTPEPTPTPDPDPDIVVTPPSDDPAPSPADGRTGPTIEVAADLMTIAGERTVIDASIDGSGIRWWKVSGPRGTSWAERSAEDAVLTFRQPGTYVLGVRASKNGEIVKRQVQVTVSTAGSDEAPPVESSLPGSSTGEIPTVDVRPADASEGQNLKFKLVLSEPVDHEVVVHLMTQDVTAVAPADYAAIRRIVVIPAGKTRAWIGVSTRRDNLKEGSEKLRLRISAVDGATIGRRGALGQIVD